MADVFVAAVVVVWVGSMATVALALRDNALPIQRREARLALSVGAALPLCLAATPIGELSRRTLVDGFVEVADEIGDALRWVAELNTSDAVWVLERAWRLVVFVLIIGLAVALVLLAIWGLFWFCRLIFEAFNLVFDWTGAPWVLPEIRPPAWTLSPDRATEASAQGKRLGDRWNSVGRSFYTRATRGQQHFDTGRGSRSDHAAAHTTDVLTDIDADGSGGSLVDAVQPGESRPSTDRQVDEVVLGVPPLPPLPALTAEGRFRLSTAQLDLRPVTGVPRLDRRWLYPTEEHRPVSPFQPTPEGDQQ